MCHGIFTNKIYTVSHIVFSISVTTEEKLVSVYPVGLTVKNLPANARDLGLIPGWGRSPGDVNGNPLQCSCLGNPMD